MAKNIKQIYDANPTSALAGNSLIYLGLSPYGAAGDSAILASNIFPTASPLLTDTLVKFADTSGTKLSTTSLVADYNSGVEWIGLRINDAGSGTIVSTGLYINGPTSGGTNITAHFVNGSVICEAAQFIQYCDPLTPIASANNMILPSVGGNTFYISGTTEIHTISVLNWRPGAFITLIFQGILTLKNKTAGVSSQLALVGNADITVAVGNNISFVHDGTYWRQTAPLSTTT